MLAAARAVLDPDLDPYADEPLLVEQRSYRAVAESPEPSAAVEAMSQVLGDFSRTVAEAIRSRRGAS